jgi:hypothetical protein
MMQRFWAATLLYALVVFCQATAQHFTDVSMPVNYPGISDGCFDALNTTVTCPSLLIGLYPE